MESVPNQVDAEGRAALRSGGWARCGKRFENNSSAQPAKIGAAIVWSIETIPNEASESDQKKYESYLQ
jgi:hypothetical protein